MKILNQKQIQQKVKRLAIQILENNYTEDCLIVAGINKTGMFFAEMLYAELQSAGNKQLILTGIKLNPANPLSSEILLDLPVSEFNGKVVIVVDDVANTGRTIYYATKPLLEVLPKKIEAAVLIDRKHKSFPIRVDYVGLTLATTLQEHIDVEITPGKEYAVYLT